MNKLNKNLTLTEKEKAHISNTVYKTILAVQTHLFPLPLFITICISSIKKTHTFSFSLTAPFTFLPMNVNYLKKWENVLITLQ